MKHVIILAGLALGLATTASAKEPQTKEAAQQAPVAKKQEVEQVMLRCVFEPVTGTRTKAYRICLTEDNWRRRAVAEAEELERLRNRDFGATAPF